MSFHVPEIWIGFVMGIAVTLVTFYLLARR